MDSSLPSSPISPGLGPIGVPLLPTLVRTQCIPGAIESGMSLKNSCTPYWLCGFSKLASQLWALVTSLYNGAEGCAASYDGLGQKHAVKGSPWTGAALLLLVILGEGGPESQAERLGGI